MPRTIHFEAGPGELNDPVAIIVRIEADGELSATTTGSQLSTPEQQLSDLVVNMINGMDYEIAIKTISELSSGFVPLTDRRANRSQFEIDRVKQRTSARLTEKENSRQER